MTDKFSQSHERFYTEVSAALSKHRITYKYHNKPKLINGDVEQVMGKEGSDPDHQNGEH